VKEIGPVSDAVIVGSASVDLLAHYGDKKNIIIHTKSFVSSLARALAGNHP
jgi:tryptophan synthase alpha subunit